MPCSVVQKTFIKKPADSSIGPRVHNMYKKHMCIYSHNVNCINKNIASNTRLNSRFYQSVMSLEHLVH